MEMAHKENTRRHTEGSRLSQIGKPGNEAGKYWKICDKGCGKPLPEAVPPEQTFRPSAGRQGKKQYVKRLPAKAGSLLYLNFSIP